MTQNIAIFASGSGSNAENIIKTFQGTHYAVKVVFCNNPKAFVIDRCKKLNLPCEVFDRHIFETEAFLERLTSYEIDYIILAGFLWKIHSSLIRAFENKIINIHPSLLPKYGGKGMFGHHVHQAVIDNHEKETGITIHLVNEEYDKGKIIFQAKCAVSDSDTADSVATKIHQLEHSHFPKVIAEYIDSQRE
jgi:phosphoribosylglycinamide formyltransferase-1